MERTDSFLILNTQSTSKENSSGHIGKSDLWQGWGRNEVEWTKKADIVITTEYLSNTFSNSKRFTSHFKKSMERIVLPQRGKINQKGSRWSMPSHPLTYPRTGGVWAQKRGPWLQPWILNRGKFCTCGTPSWEWNKPSLEDGWQKGTLPQQ